MKNRKIILMVASALAAAALLMAGGRAKAAEPELYILTFNVFDAFFGPKRGARMEAVPGAVMSLPRVPDVIVLEEAFKAEHRDLILRGLEERGYEVKGAHYVKKLYGTGIMLISRFPVVRTDYVSYKVDGDWYDPEAYTGKGVVHYVLETGRGPLEVFATHPIARFKPLYDEAGNHLDRDRRTIDRLIEMEMLSRAVFELADPSARSVVLVGDLNASPDMWSYQYLLSRTGLTDTFYALHPGEYASTYSPDNTMVKEDWSRIDHVLFVNREGEQGFWLEPVYCQVVLTEPVQIEGRPMNLSDHFGVLAGFRAVTDESKARMSPPPRPRAVKGERRPEDLASQGVMLTPENHPAWQAWAVESIHRAGKRRNRMSLRVIPAARMLIAGDVKEPTLVPLSPMQLMSLRADLAFSSAGE